MPVKRLPSKPWSGWPRVRGMSAAVIAMRSVFSCASAAGAASARAASAAQAARGCFRDEAGAACCTWNSGVWDDEKRDRNGVRNAGERGRTGDNGGQRGTTGDNGGQGGTTGDNGTNGSEQAPSMICASHREWPSARRAAMGYFPTPKRRLAKSAAMPSPASTSCACVPAAARPAPQARSAYRVFRCIATRWADNDMYGHVNNVVYYGWFDTAVNAHLIEQGVLDIHARPTIGLVVETRCNYFAPRAFPQTVEAGIRVARLGGSSVCYELGLFAQGAPLTAAAGHFIHVYVDRASRRPVPPPPPFPPPLHT